MASCQARDWLDKRTARSLAAIGCRKPKTVLAGSSNMLGKSRSQRLRASAKPDLVAWLKTA